MNILVYLVVFFFFGVLFVVGVLNSSDVTVNLWLWHIGPVPMGAVLATAAIFGVAFTPTGSFASNCSAWRRRVTPCACNWPAIRDPSAGIPPRQRGRIQTIEPTPSSPDWGPRHHPRDRSSVAAR